MPIKYILKIREIHGRNRKQIRTRILSFKKACEIWDDYRTDSGFNDRVDLDSFGRVVYTSFSGYETLEKAKDEAHKQLKRNFG